MATQKHLVFLVHGMGKHKKNWSKPLRDALVKASGGYEFFGKPGQGLKDLVTFEEIVYDSYFDEILDNWQANAEAAINAAQTDAEKAIVKDSLDWIEGGSDDESGFFWTHVVDALLWRINPYVRHAIMTDVAKRMVAGIQKQLANTFERRFSVVAHSLGTSVTHDVLDALAKGDWEDAPQPYALSGRNVRFAGVHMIANVSRMLEVKQRPAHDSRTRPGPSGDEGSYCSDFYNYRHELDPFTWARRFNPDWDESVYHAKVVSHIHEANVHDSVHYIAAPLVHIPMLRSLCRFGAVKRQEETQAIADFPSVSPELHPIVGKAQDALNKAKEAMGESPDLLDFLKGAAVFAGAVEGIRDELKSLSN